MWKEDLQHSKTKPKTHVCSCLKNRRSGFDLGVRVWMFRFCPFRFAIAYESFHFFPLLQILQYPTLAVFTTYYTSITKLKVNFINPTLSWNEIASIVHVIGSNRVIFFKDYIYLFLKDNYTREKLLRVISNIYIVTYSKLKIWNY